MKLADVLTKREGISRAVPVAHGRNTDGYILNAMKLADARTKRGIRRAVPIERCTVDRTTDAVNIRLTKLPQSVLRVGAKRDQARANELPSTLTTTTSLNEIFVASLGRTRSP